jgi:hypothetical protein
MVYQHNKVETIKILGLLQSLAITSQHWEEVLMYFITVLPKYEGKIVIMVVVDLLELLHTHLGFIFSKVFPCLLVIISHYLVSFILGENIPPREYSLSVDTSI